MGEWWNSTILRRVLSLTPGRFIPGDRAAGTRQIGGSVGHKINLDDVERRTIFPRPGLKLQLLGRPARSQSLYRLRYLDFLQKSFKQYK
jgi:hypothetical protein